MNKKVTYARFHQSVYVPGLGELGTVLPPQHKTLDNVTMTSTDHGLHVTSGLKGRGVEFLIPSANIVIMVLAPETTQAATNVTTGTAWITNA